MIRFSPALAGLVCLAGLPACQSRLGERRQYPYAPNPYGQPAPQQYGQPMQGQPPYPAQPFYSQPGAAPPYTQPAYTQPAYAQPAYAQPAYAQPAYAQPAYARPAVAPQPQVQYAPQPQTPAPQAQPAAQSSESSRKDAHPVMSYIKNLAGGKLASGEEDAAAAEERKKKTAQMQAQAAKKMVKGSFNFIRNTIRFINKTKTSEHPVEELKALAKDIKPETIRTMEEVAIPVVGNIVLGGLPMTNREKALANVGLGAAMMSSMAAANHTAFSASEFAKKVQEKGPASASLSAAADAAASTEGTNKQLVERLITNWAARGE